MHVIVLPQLQVLETSDATNIFTVLMDILFKCSLLVFCFQVGQPELIALEKTVKEAMVPAGTALEVALILSSRKFNSLITHAFTYAHMYIYIW